MTCFTISDILRNENYPSHRGAKRLNIKCTFVLYRLVTIEKEEPPMPTLEWIGKEKVINHHQDVPFRVLERQYSFDEDGKHTEDNGSENMIIHGDNLEALKALLPRYEGRVKCIYIDPPYITGEEKWIYNDNVNDPKIKKWLGEVVGKEGEDLTRHDKWLCMMYPRLKLLYKLLAEDGAIFISINSIELSSLKLICDDIFGLTNFIDIITWFKKSSPSNDAHFFSNDTEFILVYAKNKLIWRPYRLSLNTKQLKNYHNPDNDPRGPWNSATYTCNKSKDERPNLYYPIKNPFTGKLIYPNETAVWKYSKEQTQILQADNRLFWGINGDAKFPRIKKFLSEHNGVVSRSLWHYDDVSHSQGATTELKNLGITGFPTPKPSKLIERIIQIATNKDSIILDSFAGSGTTAHAVLNMNKTDGGCRKFILVELEDFADDITAERVKRVIQGYSNNIESAGGSFSFYELGESLFIDGNINNKIEPERIKEYIWFMETKTQYTRPADNNHYYLGHHNDTGYYFYYVPQQPTVLNYEFLSTITVKTNNTVIYADRCSINDDKLSQMGIVFKKIPRDISIL